MIRSTFRAALACTILGLASPAWSASTVHAQAKDGAVSLVAADGARTVVVAKGGGDAALSPDGRTLAYVREDDAQGGGSAVWLYDVATKAAHRLLASKPDDEPQANLTEFSNLAFSPDGRRLYVFSPAWATSSALHQVDPATGAQRFVAAANLLLIVRDGPHAGDLIVSKHMYHPHGPSYEQLWLLSPDGVQRMRIPGTAADSEDPGPWLKRHGWRAW